MIALWKHKFFPYILGGEVTNTRRKGNLTLVETKEYGDGLFFTPFSFLPDEAGREFVTRLKELQKEEREARSSFYEGYLDKVKSLCVEYGVTGRFK